MTTTHAMPHVVIGGGLAGFFLAARLVTAGCRVVLFDKGGGASTVAAGLYNTATGQRAAETWLAEPLVAELEAFFSVPQFASLAIHLHRQPIYRPFQDVFTQNEWSALAGPETRYSLTNPWLPGLLPNPLGGLQINGLGWLEVAAFLRGLEAILLGAGLFQKIATEVDYAQVDAKAKVLHSPGETIRYQSLTFCEGIGALHNPFWTARPLAPLKGQLIKLTVDNRFTAFAERILIGGLYMIPVGKDTFLVGSTYEKEFTDAAPDEAGVAYLSERLRKTIPAMQFEVVEARAGIRPTSPDRKPILGRHPHYPGMYFFNGLGTKGVLQAPYFSRVMADFILGRTAEVPPAVAWQRRALVPK